jgi:hypothetical protein
MPIPLPRLDDRTFDQLVSQGLDRARAACPAWTDQSPGDPGVTLVEVFAFLTETLLYRLNRVPPKLRLALLGLAGVRLQPPSAAIAALTFTHAAGMPKVDVTVPAGARIATTDGTVTFLLTSALVLKAGDASAKATALQCERIDAELIGTTTGVAGQAFRIAKPPVIAPTGDDLDLLLGIELTAGAAAAGKAVRTVDGRSFEIWQEVPMFAESGPDDPVYILDRGAGVIQLGPPGGTGVGAGRVPAAGLQVRAWYRRGGGRAGNVVAGSLTSLRDGPEGVQVVNAEAAGGGSDGETIEMLERRAPTAMASLRAAVTARDYEQVVLDAGGIARAHAYAQAQLWRHAEPGVVEVAAIPAIDASALPDGAITADVVTAHRVEALRQRAAAALDKRRPLGVRVNVAWAQVRPVSVSVRVTIGSEADPVAVEHGVRQRINTLFSPVRDMPFGRQLRASEVYERILNEPGVRYADQMVFTIAETPAADVKDLIHDPAQPGAWFATTKTGVHRTLDDGESWSQLFTPTEGETRFVRRHPTRPGLAVMAVVKPTGSILYLTRDLGETWSDPIASFNSEVSDAAWIERDGKPLLLLATAEGLRQLVPDAGTGPAPVIVDKTLDTRGFYAVTASVSASGVIAVAVAARADGGVYLSSQGGVSETFQPIGLKNKDVRMLAVQSTAARTFLWATIGAEAGEQGEGAYRLELRASGANDPDGFQPFNIGWQGGSCECLAFADALVVAGSNRAGVLTMDASATKPAWTPVKLDAGLPIRDTERLLEVVDTIAAATVPGKPPIILSGGVRGVHRSLDGGATYTLASSSTFTDHVPLPARWLYCAGTHQISLIHDQDGRG